MRSTKVKGMLEEQDALWKFRLLWWHHALKELNWLGFNPDNTRLTQSIPCESAENLDQVFIFPPNDVL